MKYKETTNRLGKSRIIKFALIAIGSVVFIKLISLGFTWYVLVGLREGWFPLEIQSILLRIVEVTNVNGIGAIGSIATAVVARYGLREATGNLTKRENETGEVAG